MQSAPWTDETFRLLFESAPSAILLVDAEGQVVLVNALAERLFGYRREELVGKSVEVLVPERFRGDHPGFRARFFENPEARPMGAGRDLFALRKDGSEVPVEIGLSPVPEGDRHLVLAAVADITERKRAEERFRLVVESAPNAIVVVDQEGRILLVNSATEALFGYERDELLGQTVEMLVPERFRGQHPGDRSRFFGSPRARPMGAGRDLFGLRKDGSEVPIEIGLNPIETEGGMLVLSAIVDITERKRAEEQLSRQASELARSNAELQEFAYVASHDLQEPLRAVAGCVGILERRLAGRLDEEEQGLADRIVAAARRMQALIEELLQYGRVDSTTGPHLRLELSEVIREAVEDLLPAATAAGGSIELGPLPAVIGDRVLLVQLFQNLVSNALKFRSEVPPRVEIGARELGEGGEGGALGGGGAQALLFVRDNGIGIDQQHGERIFRVFQRLHTRQEYAGTGVGLAVCKKVVERHGGRIWFESEPGEGTTFYFTLPLASAASQGPQQVAQRSDEPG